MQDQIKKQIRGFIDHYINVEGLPYPQNGSLERFNLWHFAHVFEEKMEVRLNDSQLQRCKTVENLVQMCYSVVILSSKNSIGSLTKESSKKEKTKEQDRSSNSKEKKSTIDNEQSPITDSEDDKCDIDSTLNVLRAKANETKSDIYARIFNNTKTKRNGHFKRF